MSRLMMYPLSGFVFNKVMFIREMVKIPAFL